MLGPSTNWLSPEEPEEDSQNRADEEAGDDGEVEGKVFADDMDVAGHSAKPAFAKATPNERADGGDREAEYHQKLSEILHEE